MKTIYRLLPPGLPQAESLFQNLPDTFRDVPVYLWRSPEPAEHVYPGTPKGLRHLLDRLSLGKAGKTLQVKGLDREHLLQAESLRKWLSEKGFFAQPQESVYLCGGSSCAAAALVLQKLREPEMKLVLLLDEETSDRRTDAVGDWFDLLLFSFKREQKDYLAKNPVIQEDRCAVHYPGVPDHGINPKEAKEVLSLYADADTMKPEEFRTFCAGLSAPPVPVFLHLAGKDGLKAAETACSALAAEQKQFQFEVWSEPEPIFQKEHVDLYLTAGKGRRAELGVMGALSYGVPAAAPAAQNLEEVVRKGCSIPLPAAPKPEDFQKAVAAFASLTEIQRASLRLNARQLWRNSFSALSNQERFLKLLQKLWNEEEEGSK